MTDQTNLQRAMTTAPGLRVVLVLALVVLGLFVVLSAGPAMRAAMHEQVTRALAEEDRRVCDKLGMRAGTDAFATCSQQLSIVRQGQVDRDQAAAVGVL